VPLTQVRLARQDARALLQQPLAAGAGCVFLLTDAADPTSNALYQHIGFVPVGRHVRRVLNDEPVAAAEQ